MLTRKHYIDTWSYTIRCVDNVSSARSLFMLAVLGLMITSDVLLEHSCQQSQGTTDFEFKLIFPEDHGWTNTTTPRIVFELNSSETISLELVLYQDDFQRVHNETLRISNSSMFTHELNCTLEEGHFIWILNTKTVNGPDHQFGPFHFSVDTEPPSVPGIESIHVKDDGSVKLFVSSRDGMSGLSELEVDLLDPDISGWSDSRSYTMEFNGTGEILVPATDLPYPHYIRCRTIDTAGNIGSFSDIIRCDRQDVDITASSITGSLSGPKYLTRIRLLDPLGIDIDTLEISYLNNNGSSPWVPVRNVTIIRISSIRSLSTSSGPIEVEFDIEYRDGPVNRRYRFRWFDLTEMPIERFSNRIVLHTIGSPPSIEMMAPRYIQTNRTRITLFVVWDGPKEEAFNIFMATDQSDYIGIDEDLLITSIDEEGWRLDIGIEIPLGTEQEFRFRIIDAVNNTAEVNWTIRATKPPTVKISGPNGQRIEDGTMTRFIAICSDPENDTLDQYWFLDGEKVWDGSSYSAVLDTGMHNITVNVTDGAYFDTDTITVLIEEKDEDHKEAEAGPELLSLLLIVISIILACSILYIAVTRKGKQRVHRIGRVKGVDVRVDVGTDHLELELCEVCLEAIDGDVIECRCGSLFHKSCASRSGNCPSCGREIMI